LDTNANMQRLKIIVRITQKRRLDIPRFIRPL